MEDARTFEHAGLTVRIVAEEYVDESYNPRECDQLGTMFCWHPDYELGDEQFSHDSHEDERQCRDCKGSGWLDKDGFPGSGYASDEEECPACEASGLAYQWDDLADIARWLREVRGASAVLPLYLIDHSGISMSVRNFAETCDPGGWDTSAVGFIYTTPERMTELCGSPDYVPPDYDGTPDEWRRDQLVSEVKEYNKYLTGDCGGYIVETIPEDPEDDPEELDACWGYLGLRDDYLTDEAKRAAEDCAERIAEEAREAASMAARDIQTV